MILPLSLLNEVSFLPEDKASLGVDVRRFFAYEQTKIGGEGPHVKTAVKLDLNKHIASTLDILQDEIEYAFDNEFGSCEDWTTISVYWKMARM